jgi:hypothetical protein
MMRRVFVATIAFLAMLATAAPAWALTLDDIKEMVAVGVPDNIIVSTIANSEETWNLSSAQIVELTQLGVSAAVIESIQGTSGSSGRSESSTREDDSSSRDRDDDRSSRDRDDDRSSRDRDDDRGSRDSDRSSRDRDDDRSSRDSDRSSRDRDDDRSSRDSDRSSRDEEPRRRTRRDDSDDGESLTRRRRRSGRDKDEESSSRSRRKVAKTPKEVKALASLYKEKKYTTVSKKAWDLIEADKYPEQEAKINFYLGSALKSMGLLHSAQVHFQKVVKEGPDAGSSFKSALSKMVDISEKTKDPIYLIRTIDKIAPDDYPGKIKDDLYYYQGVRDFERGDYARAKRNFSKLSKSSDHYIQARYHLGVIYNAQDRKKAAMKTFIGIVKGEFNGDADDITNVKNLAAINIARIRYGVEQYGKSAEFYARIPRDSTYWPTSLYEAAWAHFMGENKEAKALGNLLTLSSPFFDRVWLPESSILEALTYYRICEYKEVESLLDGFKAKYGPIQENLQEVLAPYEAGERPFADLYTRLYGVKSKDFRKLPTSVYARIEANRSFQGPHNRILQIERELARIGGMKASWSDAEVGQGVTKMLEKQRKVYMKFAGSALAVQLGLVRDQVADLMGQEALIRFEVVSGEYQKYADRFRNPEAADVNEAVEFDFATNPDIIFWPFNDEYWQDELGYYERVEPGDCKE